ncbi:zinc finger protein 501-like [Hyperolius riggenbachi]|uniref:zinc finger protein 501-like n=1 Tax=Hyperolius riggenbachi TaxID=752182 RepID=UPI0035A3D18E
MIELLTGEVSIKRDLGHKHLCKDAIMEDQLPLTSPDVSSKRNPPERHTGPLYSRKSAQEYPGIPQSTQMESLITVEVKGEEEDEEIAVPVITEEGIPLEINSGDQKITETKEDCTLSSQSKIEDDTLDSGFSKDLFSPYRLSSSESTHLPGFTEAAPAAPDVDCLFVCSSCGKCFSLKLPPEEYESSTPEMPLLCADCGWTVMEEGRFPQPQKIDTHRCSECGKTFGSNSDLVRHRLIHTGEKPFECPECGKRYRQRGALTEHQMVHAGIKPFRCSECGKRFTRKLFLLTHERTHTGEKPFSCSECGKCFSQESVLIRHRHIHTGLRPYTCSDCGKSFTQSSSFKVHQKIHTGADTFPCPECGKCFKQRKCLADHLRLHTGETPYCCIECGQRFAQKHLLQSHVKLHTGGREEDLPLPE